MILKPCEESPTSWYGISGPSRRPESPSRVAVSIHVDCQCPQRNENKLQSSDPNCLYRHNGESNGLWSVDRAKSRHILPSISPQSTLHPKRERLSMKEAFITPSSNLELASYH